MFFLLLYLVISVVWLCAIVASAGWLLWSVIAWGRGGSSIAGLKPLGLIALVFAGLTGPLWVEAVKEEIDCRIAGLGVDAPIHAADEGIYWRSHDPRHDILGPAYDYRREVAMSLLRGLVEGRIGYLEVPYAAEAERGSGSEVTNRKFYFARKENTQVECQDGIVANLPPGTCIASESTPDTQARFEMRARPSGRAIAIKDRNTGKDVGSYWYAKINRSETLLVVFGLQKLRPISCSPEKLDPLPASNLVPMVFRSGDGMVVSRDGLVEFARAAWRPITLELPDDMVPRGLAGIFYWIGRNQIRMLGHDDVELWKAATRGYRASEENLMFGNVYLVTGKIRLPAGLYGANLADWILPKGAPIPPGPRGHGNIYRIGEGCIWGICEKLEEERKK